MAWGAIAQAAGQVTGSWFQAYGMIAAAEAQKDEQEKINALKEQQANEILDREAINEKLAVRQGEGDIGQSIAAGAGAGAGGGTAALNVGLHQRLTDSLTMMRRDAEFKVRMLRAGASIDSDIANQNLRGAKIGALGSILSAGGAGGTFAQNFKSGNDVSKDANQSLFNQGTAGASDYGNHSYGTKNSEYA